MAYLYDNENPNAPKRTNGKRFWGYPTREATPSLIVVHTTESLFDQAGEDTGAEGVARYQASTDRPSSYHRLVDRDSTLVMLPDGATSFGVVGYNSRALNVSLAMRAADWSDPAKAAAAAPTLARAAAVAAGWCRAHNIPAERVTKAQADAGRRGITSHGALDPGRRSDPGVDFPWARFLEQVRGAAPPAAPPIPTEDFDMLVISAPGRGVALVGPGHYRQLSNDEEVGAALDLTRQPARAGNDRQFDLWVSLTSTGKSPTDALVRDLAAADEKQLAAAVDALKRRIDTLPAAVARELHARLAS